MSTWEPCVANDLTRFQKVVLGWRETAWERLFPSDAKRSFAGGMFQMVILEFLSRILENAP